MKIHFYESYSAFTAECSAVNQGNYYRNGTSDAHYGESFNLALPKLQNGDESLVPRAEKLLSDLDIKMNHGDRIVRTISAPYGAYPCVPEYLAGYPEPMRLVAPSDDISPVKIFVSTSTSAGITASEIMNRGITVLALVLKLQQVRPVELFLTCNLDTFEAVIPVDSKPLSLAQSCYALTAVEFQRRFSFSLDVQNGGMGGNITWGSLTPSKAGSTDNDLWLDDVHINDWKTVKSSQDWIRLQLARYTS